MPNYGNCNFWDERYAAKGDGPTFDWYQDWSTLESVLSPYLGADPLNFEILIPGCGNSRLGADLYNKGYLNITNVDSSEVVVKQMEDRFRDLDQMEFTKMDARDLNVLPDNTFDLIIDKALFDALLCSDDNIISVNKLLREMLRVLKPGGVYLMISHGPPDTRVGYLRRPAQGLTWSVETTACPKPVLEGLDEEGSSKSHFLYACKKT